MSAGVVGVWLRGGGLGSIFHGGASGRGRSKNLSRDRHPRIAIRGHWVARGRTFRSSKRDRREAIGVRARDVRVFAAVRRRRRVGVEEGRLSAAKKIGAPRWLTLGVGWRESVFLGAVRASVAVAVVSNDGATAGPWGELTRPAGRRGICAEPTCQFIRDLTGC